MSNLLALGLLIVAALLEAGGDALVRHGMAQAVAHRIGYLGLGAATLFAYSLLVNAPPWDFGRLLGVYVAVFFVAAQAVNLILFGVTPGLPTVAGGVLIVSGGLLMTFWH